MRIVLWKVIHAELMRSVSPYSGDYTLISQCEETRDGRLSTVSRDPDRMSVPVPDVVCARDVLKCLCCTSLVCHACLSTCNTGSWYRDSPTLSLPPPLLTLHKMPLVGLGVTVLSVRPQASYSCSILVYNLQIRLLKLLVNWLAVYCLHTVGSSGKAIKGPRGH